jgi:hypothetical protein
MSDDALCRTRSSFGYVAATAVLVGIGSAIFGLGELCAILLLVAFAATLGWWWFDHSLEVRNAAAMFRDLYAQKGTTPSGKVAADSSRKAGSREETDRES